MAAVIADALVTEKTGTYVDATFGGGGHSRQLLSKLAPGGRVIALDRDPSARAHAAELDDERLVFHHSNFSELDEVLAASSIKKVDGVLMDLGMSSMQVEDPQRGFSFTSDGPLDMRMDTTSGKTLAELLAKVGQRQLGQVIKEFGEERNWRKIAAQIISLRNKGALAGTADLAAACGGRYSKRHPATRVFQALRIWVNEELQNLKTGLAKAAAALKKDGVLAVLTFHSLEDRIVKRFFGVHVKEPGSMARVGRARRPSEEEQKSNPRSRSAMLRLGVKL